MTDQTDLAALLQEEWDNGDAYAIDWDRLAARLHAAGVRVTGEADGRGALARAWKRKAKMYKRMYRQQLREMSEWKSAMRLAGIGRMHDLDPDTFRVTVTVPSEKRINEIVEERIAARTGVTGDAGLDVERLARALRAVAYGGYEAEMADPMEVGDLSINGYAKAGDLAEAIAREYAATGDLCQHMIPASECRIVGCGG